MLNLALVLPIDERLWLHAIRIGSRYAKSIGLRSALRPRVDSREIDAQQRLALDERSRGDLAQHLREASAAEVGVAAELVVYLAVRQLTGGARVVCVTRGHHGDAVLEDGANVCLDDAAEVANVCSRSAALRPPALGLVDDPRQVLRRVRRDLVAAPVEIVELPPHPIIVAAVVGQICRMRLPQKAVFHRPCARRL